MVREDRMRIALTFRNCVRRGLGISSKARLSVGLLVAIGVAFAAITIASQQRTATVTQS